MKIPHLFLCRRDGWLCEDRSSTRTWTDIDAKDYLGNTIILDKMGIGIASKAGGLHKFNGWVGPIITDSGSYQVYSLALRTEKLMMKVWHISNLTLLVPTCVHRIDMDQNSGRLAGWNGLWWVLHRIRVNTATLKIVKELHMICKRACGVTRIDETETVFTDVSKHCLVV